MKSSTPKTSPASSLLSDLDPSDSAKRLDEAFSRLRSLGALIDQSHLVYTSGKHGSTYFNKDAIYPHTDLISSLCLELAGRFSSSQVDVVLAPVIGGVILSQWVAYHLSRLTSREVLALYAERSSEGGFILKRGFDRLIRDRRVLIVEDVLNTGISVAQMIDAATPHLGEGKWVGVGALVNRGGVGPEQLRGITDIQSLWNLSLDAWDEAACPLCKAGVPIETGVGKGLEYLKKKSQRP